MPIQVTCPECLSRFTVSDKFAGKSGPCPKCKKSITIPDKSQEVIIHAPEVSGPVDSKGVSVLKPIKRDDKDPSKWQLIGSAVGVVVVLIGAIVVRLVATEPPTMLLALGAIVLAPPLVMAGYSFLRDAELGAYAGKELWIRVAISSVVFAGTWGLYVGLSRYFENKSLADIDVVTMAILVGIMIAVGSICSLAAFELEIGQAFLHYSLYLVVTFLLCMIVGLPLAQPLARSKPAPSTVNTKNPTNPAANK